MQEGKTLDEKMNILHINTENSSGGASLCAKRICNAQRKCGVDARMLVAQGKEDTFISKASIDKKRKDIWYSNSLLGRIKHLLMHAPCFWDEEKVRTELKRIQDNTTERPYIHLPYSNYKDITNHPLFEWADIIHLHWVPEFIDYPTFFMNTKKPIVWTLHDKYPVVGLSHYQSDFLALPEVYNKIDDIVVKIKTKALKKAKSNIYIVAISEMMQDICAKSPITKGKATTLIHNGVDEKIFFPHNRQIARNKYNISVNATVFLFSSYNIWDKNKGLDRVIAAIESLAMPDTYLICIGENEGRKIQQSSINIIQTGKIDNQDQIAELYSASDFFLLSSYEETFAQTSIEAMSCGIPVISTPVSGSSDLIYDFNGVICQGFNEEAIAKGIQKALEYQQNEKYYSSIIREHIVKNYSYNVISKKYIKLYEEILSSK